jgi:ketosteroid isomerase-like protein
MVDNGAVPRHPSTDRATAEQTAMAFVDAINRRDIDALERLMSADHRLEVFDERPLVGRDANAEAWRGYFDAFPQYLIHVRQRAETDDAIALLGHTTGSHLGLTDDQEGDLTLIWLATLAESTVSGWRLIENNAVNRRRSGLEVDEP